MMSLALSVTTDGHKAFLAWCDLQINLQDSAESVTNSDICERSSNLSGLKSPQQQVSILKTGLYTK